MEANAAQGARANPGRASERQVSAEDRSRNLVSRFRRRLNGLAHMWRRPPKDIHRHGVVFHIRRVESFPPSTISVWLNRLADLGIIAMTKERFQELSNQLSALRTRSNQTQDSKELRSLVREMRGVLREIDELLERQTQWSRYPRIERQS